MARGEGDKRAAKRSAVAKAIAKKNLPVSSALVANDELTAKQQAYVENRAYGMGKQDAALGAGYSGAPEASRLEQLPKITEALAEERAANARSMGFSRQDVLDGLKQAIDDAKLLADPSAQIAGWREVAKICGYYAPEVKQIQLSAGQLRARGELELMSDDELLQLAGGSVIEGQSTRVPQ
jgi:hypothetical protein